MVIILCEIETEAQSMVSAILHLTEYLSNETISLLNQWAHQLQLRQE